MPSTHGQIRRFFASQAVQVAARCATPRRPSRACLPAFRSGRDTARCRRLRPVVSYQAWYGYTLSVGRIFVAIQLIC
jgi:hypothetical protein